MQVTYDPRGDAVYVSLRRELASVAQTKRVDEDIALDFAEDGTLVGIEVLNASERLRLDEISDLTMLTEEIVQAEI
jgi:uncharacterized protein YuzE